MQPSRVELYAAIRRASRAGLSGREIERKHGVGRRTVNAALTSAWPAPRKQYPRRGSKLDPFKPVIDAMLRTDLDAPRKQQHTIKRIYSRLIDEHAMTDIAYQTVRDYVANRKPADPDRGRPWPICGVRAANSSPWCRSGGRFR